MNPLALFDLDQTIIDSDSDFEWYQFMVDKKLLTEREVEIKNQFTEAYHRGELDVEKCYAHCGENLAKFPMEQLIEIRAEFVKNCVMPHFLEEAHRLINWHKAQGHTTLLISATCEFLVEQTAKETGFDYFIGTKIAMENNCFLPKLEGTPSFGKGKVTRMKEWLENQPDRSASDLKNSWFYSDSLNDIPLLEEVAHPVAVNPDATLQKHAKNKGWKIMDFRKPLSH